MVVDIEAYKKYAKRLEEETNRAMLDYLAELVEPGSTILFKEYHSEGYMEYCTVRVVNASMNMYSDFVIPLDKIQINIDVKDFLSDRDIQNR